MDAEQLRAYPIPRRHMRAARHTILLENVSGTWLGGKLSRRIGAIAVVTPPPEYQGALIMAHRDRVGGSSGRRKGAGDAVHPPSAAAAPLLRRTGRQNFSTPPTGRIRDRNGGLPRLSDGVAHAFRCPASPRRALRAENLGKPSPWVMINAPWYYVTGERFPGPGVPLPPPPGNAGRRPPAAATRRGRPPPGAPGRARNRPTPERYPCPR